MIGKELSYQPATRITTTKSLFFVCLILFIASCSSAPKAEQEEEISTKVKVGQIITPLGEILFLLHDQTPNHKKSFIQLAEAGYWDSLTFNRVIDNFVAQGGCPDTPEGFNDPEYLLAPEFVDSLTHIYGAVGAGRDGNPEKLSARCQFYIVQNKEGLHRLDGDYTVFGQVIKGMDIVDAMVKVETDSTDMPFTPITLDVNVIELEKGEW